jgi:hypothetical protein
MYLHHLESLEVATEPQEFDPFENDRRSFEREKEI